MDVVEVVARQLAVHGVDHVFGVVGSGNFQVTNALVKLGVRFVAAAHEGGAASMADGYARVCGRLPVLSVHQGPGLTNALTGITEAAKSRTSMIVLVPEATNPVSNFYLDVAALADSIGAAYLRVRADHVADDVASACRTARHSGGRTVLLGLPLDIQSRPATESPEPSSQIEPMPAPAPSGQIESAPATETPAERAVAPSERAVAPAGIDALVAALLVARRPVFIAGRGATRQPDAARGALTELAERCGALLAVSAAAKGLFEGEPWNLDISGGFASPLAAELIAHADLVVAWGSTLNMWTTRHGRLIAPDAVVAQVDLDPSAIGTHRTVHIGVEGDVTAVARDCLRAWPSGAAPSGWRTAEVRERIATTGAWRTVPYVETSERDGDAGRIDPRTLTIALDDLLPRQRTVAVDSGNFMGYPSMFLSVPDQAGFCFTQAFQSIGLGLASAIGAAIARPDRLTVAALGDGGFLMSVAELTTAVRLGLRMLIVVYNDAAYGAEVHHFGPHGHPLDTVTFPDTDLAAIARGFGCGGVTVRSPDDLTPVRDWVGGGSGPFLVDAKITSTEPSWWLEEAFRGH